MGAFGHIICFILTLITGGLFIPLWILLALCGGSSKRKTQTDLLREQNQLLKDLKQQNMYKGYRD
jgi:hypothetical protein